MMQESAPKRRYAQSLSADVSEQCDIVTAALNAGAGQKHVPVMPSGRTCPTLLRMVQTSLGVPMDERHPYQHIVVGMVSESMDAIRQEKLQEIEASRQRVSEMEAEKSAKDAARIAAEETLESMGAACLQSESIFKVKSQEVDEAERIFGNGAKASHTADQNLSDVITRREALLTGISECFEPLKSQSTSSAEGKKLLTKLNSITKKFDHTMMVTLRNVLSLEPDERTPFGANVIEHFETEYALQVEEATALVSECETIKQKCDASLESAQIACDEAVKALDAASAGLNSATLARLESQKKLDEVNKAAAASTQHYDELVHSVDIAQEELDTFLQGAYAAFTALRERSSQMQ